MAQISNNNDKWQQLAKKADGYRMPLSDEKLDAMYASISSRVGPKNRRRKMLWPILIGTAAAAILAILLLGVLHNPNPDIQQAPKMAKNADEIGKNSVVGDSNIQAKNNSISKPSISNISKSDSVITNDVLAEGDTLQRPITLEKDHWAEQTEAVAHKSDLNSEEHHQTIPDFGNIAEAKGVDKWSISLYTTASLGGTLDNPYNSFPMQGGISAKPGLKLVGQRWHSAVPITVGLNAQYMLTKRMALETGIVYTYIKQHRTLYYSNDMQVEDRLATHYIGIPVRIDYIWWQRGNFGLYTALGGSLSVPISTDSSVRGKNGPVYVDQDKYDDKGVQLSAEVGVGAQYRLYSNMAVYLEPGAKYYFNTSKRPGMFDDHPFCFSIQAGFRFGF